MHFKLKDKNGNVISPLLGHSLLRKNSMARRGINLMSKKILLLNAILILLLLSACQPKDIEKEEEVTLKVVYYDQNTFNRDYGDLFSTKYPNIKIEVLPITYYSSPKNSGEDSIRQYMLANLPDIVLLRDIDLGTLSQKNELLNLSPLIKEDKYDIDNMLPSVIDLLKKSGEGEIFGLAPTFENTALYYNKDIFNKLGIDYPTDNMTWNDVLLLSQRFSENDSAYGFYKGKNSSLFNFVIKRIGYISGINFYNAKDKIITVNTESWRSIFRLIVDGYNKKSIFLETSQERKSFKFSDEAKIKYGTNLFIMGKAAMTTDSISLASDLENAKQSSKSIPAINWEVVTIPVDPSNPNETNSFHLDRIFAINAKSQKVKASWELIKFINSEELAKFKSKSSTELLTRYGNMKEMYGHDVEAFYKLKPSGNYYNSDNLPDEFYQEFMTFGNDEIFKVIQGTSRLEDALLTIERTGQVILNKYVNQ
jgi:multiple sugar transport system substrate-binding protein